MVYHILFYSYEVNKINGLWILFHLNLVWIKSKIINFKTILLRVNITLLKKSSRAIFMHSPINFFHYYLNIFSFHSLFVISYYYFNSSFAKFTFNPFIFLNFRKTIKVKYYIIMDIRPSNTIYINNLNEKIKKEGKSSC